MILYFFYFFIPVFLFFVFKNKIVAYFVSSFVGWVYVSVCAVYFEAQQEVPDFDFIYFLSFIFYLFVTMCFYLIFFVGIKIFIYFLNLYRKNN